VNPSIPFSFLDDKQQPIGYAVELCMKIVDTVKADLKLPNLKVVMQPVTSSNRIPLLRNGTIDLECGSTTNSKVRQEQVSFGPNYFVINVTAAVKKTSNINTLADLNGNAMSDLSNSRTSGSRLLVVDDNSFYAGNYSLIATSDGDWSVTIKRPDTSSARQLPVSFSGGEPEGAVSAPFKAHKGYIQIAYTFARSPYGSGYVYIYDVLTGESFYTRPMTSGYELGQSMADVPAEGVYIAQASMPPGSSYGEITISQ